jgi:PEGA domain
MSAASCSTPRVRRAIAAGMLAVALTETVASTPCRAAPPAASASPAASPLPPLADSLTGPAREDYESGRVLFDNNDFSGALVKFQHAYELSSDARLLWDMGACEKNQRHYVHVLRLVERYLHDADVHLTAEQREGANAVIRTVRSLVSAIHVTVNEPDASIYVDDELVGTSPLMEPLLVDLGDRHIRVTKAGFKDQTLLQHAVGAIDVLLTIALEHEAREGRLSVRANVSGAVAIDEKVVGVTPWEGPLATGPHVVRVTAAGTIPYSTDVVLRDGEVRTLDVTLQAKSGGIPVAFWIAGGVLVAAGLGVGGYFLFRPTQSTTYAPAMSGTISPGVIPLSY